MDPFHNVRADSQASGRMASRWVASFSSVVKSACGNILQKKFEACDSCAVFTLSTIVVKSNEILTIFGGVYLSERPTGDVHVACVGEESHTR